MPHDTKRWMRFRRDGRVGFGLLDDDQVVVHDGDPFGERSPTGERLSAE